MKKHVNPTVKAHLIRIACYLFLVLAVFVVPLALGRRDATNSRIVAAKMALAVGPSRTSGTAEAQASISPAPALTPIALWDQYNLAGNKVTLSATFTDSPALNSDLADDFVVPLGQAWWLRWIDVDGAYFNGSGPVNSFNVFFYSDIGGFPGMQLYGGNITNWTQNGRTFTIHISDSCCEPELYPGTYWVEVQANMTASCCGEWGWTDRTATNVNAAAWQNPSGFFGACQSWGRRGVTCGLDALAPDQVYRLNGNQIFLPCFATSSACGSIVVRAAPREFTVNLSAPADPATVQGSDFTVNGTPANTAILSNNNITITFHFNTSPAVEGQNTMHIPGAALNCGFSPVQEFTCTFTYQGSATPRPRPSPAPRP